MQIPLQNLPLFSYLHSLNPVYYGKVFELRDVVQNWLNYIPETFPHYTRHTIPHSDEILIQVSNLLFRSESQPPILLLSAAEVYVLMAAAYLHDSGMVAGHSEKLEILTSDSEWKAWVSDGGGAQRWNKIQQLRFEVTDLDEVARHFVADLQTRYLLAEFIRRRHHSRAADVIQQYQSQLGRFAFDDFSMQRTIADVCLSHGLNAHELEDRERYPDLRHIQGYQVNVKLLAILLRLGDLLDLSYDRACPLLMNPANPLPPESLAHWGQYQRIAHRSTSPDRIEISAQCETQEEHRVLQDWCSWLVEETRNARTMMNRSQRHGEWQPPMAFLDGPNQTIKITALPGAKYIPSTWTFELDHNAVLQLLIKDIYEDPSTFIRELIQNALDATRCRLYEDLRSQAKRIPEYPTQISKAFRKRYPINITVFPKAILNELSGELEERYVLAIEDFGIGMDREVIQRYFLQVGRSFYTTDEFQRAYQFIPTSRFGVGFLSVFAASDHIVVETYKPSSGDGPLRLTLRGPRNYLLTEIGTRTVSGTRIEVVLHEWTHAAMIEHQVRWWCKRVELPIRVTGQGYRETIIAEDISEFVKEIPDVTNDSAKYAVRAFTISRPGIEGELYVFSYVDDKGEQWDKLEASRDYVKEHPKAIVPNFPGNLVCLHGISLGEDTANSILGKDHGIRVRLDFRGSGNTNLSRTSLGSTSEKWREAVTSRAEEILQHHLEETNYAKGEEGWIYKNRLASIYPISRFWHSLEMIPVHVGNHPFLMSFKNLESMKIFTSVHQKGGSGSRSIKRVAGNSIKEPYILALEFAKVYEGFSDELFLRRKATNIRSVSTEHVAIDWEFSDNYEHFYWHRSRVQDFPQKMTIAVSLDFGEKSSILLFNRGNAIFQWMDRVRQARKMISKAGLPVDHFDKLIHALIQATEGNTSMLQRYLQRWCEIPKLSSDLYPPTKRITTKMFSF